LARASKVFPEWTDRDPSDFGMLFLDLWAYAADIMHYYIDRAAGEFFLPTATQRESVLALANLLDYIPSGRTSAVGDLTLDNAGGTDYTVPANTRFIARVDNETFQVYTKNGGVIPANDIGTIEVFEGTLTEGETLTTSSSGQDNQRYIIRNKGVVSTSVSVYVYENGIDPVQYQRVRRINQSDTGERVYVLNVASSGDVSVVFGNSLNGFVPPAGSLIKVDYAVSSGSKGNLPADSILAFRDLAPDGIIIASNSAFAGGDDEESIAVLKASIPSVISAQNRAVTRSDFVSLATQVESVSKASIAFIPGNGGVGASANASVTIFAQPYRSDYLTTADVSQTVSTDMREAVVRDIQPKALLGVTVLASPTVTWNPIDLTVTVNVNERSVSNWVLRDCEQAIDELFTFDNVFFGQRITLGQIYRILLNVPGVDYVTVTRFDDDGGMAVEEFILTPETELPKKGTVVFNMVGGITTSS
jgi:uncharacterized phage protein gp47/JayE